MSDDRSKDGAPGDIGDIPPYPGPYEQWNFGVGRDYALPFMRDNWTYISALAEIGKRSKPTDDAFQRLQQIGWLPTFWSDAADGCFVPFVVKNPPGTMPTLDDLTDILTHGLISATQPVLQAHADDKSIAQAVRDALKSLPFRIPYSRYRVAFPVAACAMNPQPESAPKGPPDWSPDGDLQRRIGKKEITVIAVIDDGIPFAHRNFCDKTGAHSRVEFCWLQSVKFDAKQKSVLFGREYIRPEIEKLIAQHGDDEDKLYREARAIEETEGLGSLLRRHASHGAHVMDLATGYSPERGRPASDGTTPDEEAREEIRIIAVQLPNTIAWDTSGFGKDMYMLSAFHYIFHRADILAKGYEVKNLRLVINFSYGFSGGRHDGETELEAAIDELVCKRRTRKPTDNEYLGPSPTALVLPAGNTFLERLHGLIRPEDFVDGTASFHWRVQPNDRTPSYLELWFWGAFSPSEPFGFDVALRDPDGNVVSLQDPTGKSQTSLQVGADHQGDNLGDDGDPRRVYTVLNPQQQVVGQLSSDWHRGDVAPATSGKTSMQRTGRWRVLLVIAPTEPEDPRLPRAAAGKWTVVIRRTIAALIEYPIHCWIQRSADPESLRSGSRQSYFDDDAYESTAFTLQGDLSEQDDKTFVQRFGSLNGLATGRTALVVGGYRLGAGLGSSIACARPARYSSAGVLPKQRAAEETYAPPCPVGPREAAAWPDKHVNASSMSDRSRALPGTIAAGVRSGSLSLVHGTSAAAPFVARKLAEIFTTADAADIAKAQDSNYLTLIRDDLAKGAQAAATTARPYCPQPDDELTEARLGNVRVRPHWQPGAEPK
jgi:hypothetical protein